MIGRDIALAPFPTDASFHWGYGIGLGQVMPPMKKVMPYAPMVTALIAIKIAILNGFLEATEALRVFFAMKAVASVGSMGRGAGREAFVISLLALFPRASAQHGQEK